MTETAASRLHDAIANRATRLDLRGLGLTGVPLEVYELADSLEILDLSGNELCALPGDFARLHRLRIVFCSENRFSEWPAVLGACGSLEMIGFKSNRIAAIPEDGLPPRLRWLILTDNRLEALPQSIGRCPRLQKLMLAGNRLPALPDAMAKCVNLELIRLAANRIDAFPRWLFRLPRLAWLALAGNPGLSLPHPDAMEEISWDDLTAGEILGQGASGVIHRADWQMAEGDSRAVAVKLFKGGMTSDGLPAQEMAACLAAGNHPNLIGVLGNLRDHPDEEIGLVLPLVPPGFQSLAGPPDFDTCTRDVYAEDRRFSAAEAVSILAGTASAMRHLHFQGLGHGDFYAHNLLVDGLGGCLLGDFGAASFCPPEMGLERVEVRAFACLMEEILMRIEPPAEMAGWAELQQRCAAEDVAGRPDFDEICRVMEALPTI